jgi:hypothetical protein
MTSVSLKSIVVKCPKCPPESEPAELLDGEFSFAESVYNVLTDGLSAETLAAIHGIFLKLYKREITLEQAKADVDKVSPKATRLFDVGNWGEDAQAQVLSSGIMGVCALLAGLGGAMIMRPLPAPAVAPPAHEVSAVTSADMAIGRAVKATLRPKPRPKPLSYGRD